LCDEFLGVNTAILQSPFKRISVNLIVEGEDDRSTVSVFHFDVAASTMNFRKAKTLKRDQHLAA
jgi:hypothetical protein